jgi:hypothetical protein
MSPPRPTSTDAPGANLARVLLVILNGSLAIVALWAFTLVVTGRDRLGIALILALLTVPLANGAVIAVARFLARRRR